MHLEEVRALIANGFNFVVSALGYTPANKAGDTFTGNVGVVATPVAGYQLTAGSPAATDAKSQFRAVAGFSSYLTVVGNNGAAATQGFDVIHGSSGEAYLWNRLNFEIRFGTNNTESARLTAPGSFNLLKSGQGFGIKEGGAAARMGTATLVAGTVTINTTSVTVNSRIFVQAISNGGTPGHLVAGGIVAGTSFTVSSSSGTDIRSIAWIIFEPT